MLLNCKFCGGDLDITEGAAIAECKYCRTKQTLPKAEDDSLRNLFNRANALRRRCEFDKAEAVYEKIVETAPNESEAYYGLVLCKYGIEYVDDKSSGKMVPTCHRASFDSIIADGDFKSAIEHADYERRTLYEEQAREIDRIQKDILALAQKEESYDVFICYKETDETGGKTRDSVIANDIYYELTDAGFKVFYAAITLEGKLGRDYEPIIFAALNSAKVMLVVGTKPEYFNAIWVKNEWSRYLKIIKKDRKKLLIPCYRDMDAYDLPDEFAHLQAQDMGKIGFANDLVRGIKKVMESFKPKQETVVREIKETVIKEPVIKETTVIREPGGAPIVGGVNTAALIERAFMFLEDGDFEKADEFCEQVLNQEPKNPSAYLGKLMAELNVKKREDLKHCAKPFDGSGNYKKLARFGDGALNAELDGYIKEINERNEAANRESVYLKAMDDYKTYNISKLKKAVEVFNSIADYKDARDRARACEEKIQRLQKKAEDERIERERAAEAAREAERIKEAASLKEKLEREKAEKIKLERQAEERRIENEKRKKRKIKIAFIATSAVAFVIAFVIVLNTVILPSVMYNDAIALMSELRYTEAIAKFEKLGEYKDSVAKMEESVLARKNLFIAQYGQEAYDRLGVVEVGGYIKLGKYDQWSYDEEPIEWLVLDVKDGKALVISKYGLDCKKYNETYTDVTWETCSLRRWLNNGFFNAAFSAEDKELIVLSDVPADSNPDYDTSPGNATQDYIFLLSVSEANTYFSSEKERKCKPTWFAATQGASYFKSNGGYGMWWLRTPGHRQDSATFVGDTGNISESGNGVHGSAKNVSSTAVRPAMWIEIK